MEWLKDPKNQPKVVAGFVVIMLVVGTILFLQMRGPGDGGEMSVPPTDPSASTPAPAGPGAMPPPPGAPAPGAAPGAAPTPAPGAPGDPMAGAAPSQPGAAPGQPGTAAPAPATKKVAKALEANRDDPFLPFDWKPKVQPRYELVKIPMPGRMFTAKLKGKDIPHGDTQPEPPQPPRRMAGILFKDRIYAIMETSGPAGYTSMVVKPGDITDDGMRVERIEPNKIVLETTRGKYRRVDVKMAASQRMPEQSNMVDTGSQNPVGPMMPRGPYYGPRGPMAPMGPGAGDM